MLSPITSVVVDQYTVKIHDTYASLQTSLKIASPSTDRLHEVEVEEFLCQGHSIA